MSSKTINDGNKFLTRSLRPHLSEMTRLYDASFLPSQLYPSLFTDYTTRRFPVCDNLYHAFTECKRRIIGPGLHLTGGYNPIVSEFVNFLFYEKKRKRGEKERRRTMKKHVGFVSRP